LVKEAGAARVDHDPKYRHGTYVIPYEDKFYMFTLRARMCEGWNEFDAVDAAEVIPKEVVAVEWVPT
jgi:hypothetical protein